MIQFNVAPFSFPLLSSVRFTVRLCSTAEAGDKLQSLEAAMCECAWSLSVCVPYATSSKFNKQQVQQAQERNRESQSQNKTNRKRQQSEITKQKTSKAPPLDFLKKLIMVIGFCHWISILILRPRENCFDWTTCKSLELMFSVSANEHMLQNITFIDSNWLTNRS
jgi:hypothetical protein